MKGSVSNCCSYWVTAEHGHHRSSSYEPYSVSTAPPCGLSPMFPRAQVTQLDSSRPVCLSACDRESPRRAMLVGPSGRGKTMLLQNMLLIVYSGGSKHAPTSTCTDEPGGKAAGRLLCEPMKPQVTGNVKQDNWGGCAKIVPLQCPVEHVTRYTLVR